MNRQTSTALALPLSSLILCRRRVDKRRNPSKWYAFNIHNPSGTLSSDLQLRGTLFGTPSDDANQFVAVMALSESMFDIQYQGDGNPVPMLTHISPLS